MRNAHRGDTPSPLCTGVLALAVCDVSLCPIAAHLFVAVASNGPGAPEDLAWEAARRVTREAWTQVGAMTTSVSFGLEATVTTLKSQKLLGLCVPAESGELTPLVRTWCPLGWP